MALAATVEATNLPFDEAIAFFARKTNVGTKAWTDVWETAHARAFMVAGATKAALVEDFRQAIHKAIAEGTTLAEFRKDFDRIVAKHGWTGWKGEESVAGRAWRTRVIYETNLNMAYSAGRYAEMSDPDVLRIFPFWVYRHSGNPHPRLQHKAWDGLTLEATNPFWLTNYPPNGFGCGCTVEPISARGLARQGKSGPDASPPLDIQPKPIGLTGRFQATPAGVDPGFAYNPGMAWKGEVTPPHDTVMKTAPGWKPPPPAPPAPPIPAAEGTSGPVAPPPMKGSMEDWVAAKLKELGKDSTLKIPPLDDPEWSSPLSLGPTPPRGAVDLAAADRRLRTHYDGWAASLSGAERGTLSAYKGAAYDGINKHLDGRRPDTAMAAIVKTLDGALAKAPPAPRPMTVFRGIGRDDPLARARLGSLQQQRPFLSTSISVEKAESFAATHDGIVVEIRVPEGYHGIAWVHPYPDVHFVEWEALFRPGSRFRVQSREGGRLIVEAVDEPNRRPRLAPRRPRRTLSG